MEHVLLGPAQWSKLAAQYAEFSIIGLFKSANIVSLVFNFLKNLGRFLNYLLPLSSKC